MRKKRKGQVALEFLMTYGWAFLIILVVIGAFVYFNVLNPGRHIGGNCILTAGTYCNAHSIETDRIQMEIRNDLGSTITIHEARISPAVGGHDDITCDFTGEPISISVGRTDIITCDDDSADWYTGEDALEAGERYQGDVVVIFSTAGSKLNRTATGGISGTVI